ncbi:uncharacterized protein LOC116845614 [Odontomachus brunneus]|uniref:uncharacterized protein LOC116845614 n=1 Tax=Odontomachus brunneus TaxID=486640 RepID=UPI0013F27FC9|nr:uncharacterized protein LOC116845614 [Odontomachus brunneus]XP_032674415.1 uncharacterized protein LOC116845614 [Odontomachus brunneus]
MTGWRMRPTAWVLGVIAIVSVMITVTASEMESGVIERSVNRLDEEDRQEDERIVAKNHTVETVWFRDNNDDADGNNDTAVFEETISAFAIRQEDDRHVDKPQRDQADSRLRLVAGLTRSLDNASREGVAMEYTTWKDSLVTVTEVHSENVSKKHADEQTISASKRIEDSEQAEEALAILEHEDAQGTNESTIEKAKDDWPIVSMEEAKEEEEEDENKEEEDATGAKFSGQKNVDDIRAISFQVPPLEAKEEAHRDEQGKSSVARTKSEKTDEMMKPGESRKNQSRPANNLLLSGKSTKAFYEIKPSIRTLEMDHEQHFHATTHRPLSGRKFVLPSVDSAYGKFGPYFEDGDQELNITARIGSTVLLDCKIGMLGDKQVTWLQHSKDSFRLLTVGRIPYSVDQRISLNFRYPSNWRLQILYASPRDSGLYKCQVATHPPLVKKINVVVTAPALTISDDSGRIVSKERHLKAGSVLRLRCEARDVLESLNESVVWTRGDETLTEDVSENRTTEISAGKEVLVIVSTLIVERASPRHAGNYSCMVAGKAKTTVAVHVLNGELPAAVHDGNGVSRAFLNLWLVHLTMSYVFTR